MLPKGSKKQMSEISVTFTNVFDMIDLLCSENMNINFDFKDLLVGFLVVIF